MQLMARPLRRNFGSASPSPHKVFQLARPSTPLILPRLQHPSQLRAYHYGSQPRPLSQHHQLTVRSTNGHKPLAKNTYNDRTRWRYYFTRDSPYTRSSKIKNAFQRWMSVLAFLCDVGVTILVIGFFVSCLETVPVSLLYHRIVQSRGSLRD